MLQWMGGSRRKVATSRKSTQKRQKQYFEQRKRKQQHYQADAENYYEGNSIYNQQNTNNKSLDVLCLQNLSAVSGEPNSCYLEPNTCCPKGTIDDVTITPKYQTTLCPQAVQTNEVTQISPPRTKLEESSSCDLVDTVCPRNFPVGASESQKQKFKGNWNTSKQSKMPTEHDLSVIDILGDDGPSSNFEENVGHEAHVAFSIKGLGKVDAETPVHSPERPGRNFSYEQYLRPKERIKTHSSIKITSRPDSIEHELFQDTMMRDIGTPIYRSPVEPSFSSRSVEDLFGSPKQNLFANNKFSPVTDYDTNLEDIFEDVELFGKERRNNIQNATPSFLPYGIIDQEEYGLPCKNELDQMDFCSSLDHRDFFFESHQWKKSASIPSPLETNDRDSPSLFSTRQMIQPFEDSDPNIKWNYSMGTTREHPFVDNKKRAAHSCSASDNTTDSFSLPSEESCFSAAAKGDLSKYSRSRYGTNHHKNTMETKHSFCNDGFDPEQRYTSGGPGNFSGYSTTARDRWFSEDIFNLGEGILGTGLYNDDPLLFEKHRGFPGEHSRCCKRVSEEPSIPKPAIIIISSSVSGSSLPNLFQTSKRERISEASNISSSYLEDQCSDTTKEPICITPDLTETTNASKPLEPADETSSCAEVSGAVAATSGSGDPSKATSQ